MSNLPTILFIAIFALGSLQLNTATKFRDKQIDADAVQNTITQLAQAQYRRVSDPTSANFGVYAATAAQLHTEGYLAHWSGSTNYVFDLSPASGFAIQYSAQSVGDAQRAAERMGDTASVTGSTVSFAFAAPQDLALFDIFVKKEGDEMYGSLNMRTGAGANLNMNDNDIESQGNVTLSNSAGTANISTDTANAGSLTVQTFRIVN